jgi:hypothetical protein
MCSRRIRRRQYARVYLCARDDVTRAQMSLLQEMREKMLRKPSRPAVGGKRKVDAALPDDNDDAESDNVDDDNEDAIAAKRALRRQQRKQVRDVMLRTHAHRVHV